MYRLNDLVDGEINADYCNEFLERSLVVLGPFGGNDYTHSFLSGAGIDEVNSFVPLVVNAIASATKVSVFLYPQLIYFYSVISHPRSFVNLLFLSVLARLRLIHINNLM